MKPTYLQQHGNLCVLSVDDDQVNLMVMETLLQPQGWKVRLHQIDNKMIELAQMRPCLALMRIHRGVRIDKAY